MKTKTALKKTKTALKVLERTMYNTRQSIHFKGMYELSGIKLRINIRKDSYDFQSYARVYVLNKEEREWNVLHSIPYPQMEAVKKNVFHGRPADELTFSERTAINDDIKSLQKMAKKLLS